MVTGAATVVTASTAYVQRQMVKWLEHLALALHLLGKLWERCRNIRCALLCVEPFNHTESKRGVAYQF